MDIQILQTLFYDYFLSVIVQNYTSFVAAQ